MAPRIQVAFKRDGSVGRPPSKSDELLNREIFYTLQEAKVLIERWRSGYNRVRPHSALGYRPPAPDALQWPPRATGSTTPQMQPALT